MIYDFRPCLPIYKHRPQYTSDDEDYCYSKTCGSISESSGKYEQNFVQSCVAAFGSCQASSGLLRGYVNRHDFEGCRVHHQEINLESFSSLFRFSVKCFIERVTPNLHPTPKPMYKIPSLGGVITEKCCNVLLKLVP